MSPATLSLDRRRAERFPIELPIQITDGAASGILGSLINLSHSGALITANAELDPRSRIQVRLYLALQRRQTVMQARVVRSLDGQIGIEWCDFTPAGVRELVRAASVVSARAAGFR